MNFLQANSGNYKSGRDLTIQYLVIHYTGNSKDTAKGNATYFKNNVVKTSAHYFVDEDEVWQSVSESDTAWHCGGDTYYCGARNANSIGIEMCDSLYSVPERVKNRTVELCKTLVKKYGITRGHIVRHYDVTHKVCPAPYVYNNVLWNAFLDEIFKTSTTTASTTSSGKVNSEDMEIIRANSSGYEVKVAQSILKGLGFYDGSIDGKWGPKSQAAVKEWKQSVGITPVNGGIIASVWSKLLHG